MTGADLRLADLLVALSVITDLGMGQSPEKAVRACLLATALARRMGASEGEVRNVYYTSLLRHLGCTATAHEEAYLFGGDELVSRPAGERTDFGDRREVAALLLGTGRGTGLDRPRYLTRTLRAGKEADRMIVGSVCEVAAQLAGRLDLEPGVVAGVVEVFERWDGKGGPRGIGGDEIGLPARLAEMAHQVVIFDRIGGVEAAVGMVKARAGGLFDPGAARVFVSAGVDLLEEIDSADVWQAVLEVEPDPVRMIPEWGIDNVARAFADMIDLKAPFMLGHSTHVGELASEAARHLGLGDDEITAVRRAGFLHDVGRVAVSNGVWEKTRAFHDGDWERVRLHPYFTERILSRSAALQPLARMAGMHHERHDGSGYHHRASGREIPTGARLLAAADVYQAVTQDRPHRHALAPDDASSLLQAESRAGRLDGECTGAVLAAAGQDQRIRTSWPAGLSDREVEVLRLVAKGLPNRSIAEALFVSPRTAEHHVQHIYNKIGVATRAGAAMYAMEHDLIRP